MSLISKESTGTNQYKLSIKIDGDVLSGEIDKVISKMRSNVNVPGFRKGKAPVSVLREYFGDDRFYEEAMENLVNDAYSAAAEESGLDIVSDPYEYEQGEIGAEGAEFSVKVDVRPSVTVGEYHGLHAEKVEPAAVDDHEVEHRLEHLREDNSRLIDVDDRPVQDGDTVNINYSGMVGNKRFSGGKADHQDLVIGSNSFIPGFEEQIIGHSKGEKFIINVTFPKEYHAPKLAGRDATFMITINSISYKEVPELDDDFAKDVSEDCDTMEELRAQIRADLEKTAAENAENAFQNNVLTAFAAVVEGEIPDSMVNVVSARKIQNLANNVSQYGISFEQYLGYMGKTVESLYDEYHDSSLDVVKIELGLGAVAEKEGIEVTDEELEAKFTEIAETYGTEVDKIREQVSADTVKGDLRNEKAIKVIVDSAVADEPAPKEEEAPAEEAAAEEAPAEEGEAAPDAE